MVVLLVWVQQASHKLGTVADQLEGEVVVEVVGHKLGSMMKLVFALWLQGGGCSESLHGPRAFAAEVAYFDLIVGVMGSQNPELDHGPESPDQIFHSCHLVKQLVCCLVVQLGLGLDSKQSWRKNLQMQYCYH